MFDVANIAEYEKTIKAWLYKMHQDVYYECDSWKRHTDNMWKMDKLINALAHDGFDNEKHDALYEAIGDHQLDAADVAYFIGLRHGIAAYMAISSGNIKDIIEKGK